MANRVVREKLSRRPAPKVYAFDVDDTVDVAGGPVTLAMMQALHDEGHTVGLCGNWPVFTRSVIRWQGVIKFMGPDVSGAQDMTIAELKADFLVRTKASLPGAEHVMVGNSPPDDEAARAAGWRFIKESDFAKGAR